MLIVSARRDKYYMEALTWKTGGISGTGDEIFIKRSIYLVKLQIQGTLDLHLSQD